MHDIPRLLIDEPPLQVLPSLATAIGLNEAIFLQQLHYQLRLRQHLIDEVPWVFNTLEQWQSLFPFWSLSTVRRIIAHLEHLGLVRSANHNHHRQVQTRWYTINYETLQAIPTNNPSGQNDHVGESDWTDLLNPKTPSKEKPPYSPPRGTLVTMSNAQQASPTYSVGFLSFWAGYPVKKGKASAWKAWQRLQCEPLASEICRSVTQHQQADADWQKGYIKHPATYLNGRCWEDEFASPHQPPHQPTLVL